MVAIRHFPFPAKATPVSGVALSAGSDDGDGFHQFCIPEGGGNCPVARLVGYDTAGTAIAMSTTTTALPLTVHSAAGATQYQFVLTR